MCPGVGRCVGKQSINHEMSLVPRRREKEIEIESLLLYCFIVSLRIDGVLILYVRVLKIHLMVFA